MEYLVYQSVIVSEKSVIDNNTFNNKIQINTFIRKVLAENKEEAIGKFVLDTSKEVFIKRIDPLNCFELEKLKTI